MSEINHYPGRLYRYGAIGMSIVALSGCGSSDRDVPATNTITETKPNQSFIPGSYEWLIEQLGYEAIQGKKPEQSFSFSTLHSTTNLYNLTGEYIDESETMQTIETLESLAAKSGHFTLQAEFTGGGTAALDYRIVPRDEDQRYILIIPPLTEPYRIKVGAFKPEQSVAYSMSHHPTQNSTVSIIRASAATDPSPKKAQELLFTELCQTSFFVQSRNSDAHKYGQGIQNLGQEDACNSFGRVMASAKKNVPYKNYYDKTADHKILVPGVGTAPYLTFNQSEYQAFQKIFD